MEKLPVKNRDGCRLSVVIPAYEEEAVIEKTLNDVAAYLETGGLSYEIILVCDGCKDKTADIAAEVARKNDRIVVIDSAVNRGKGFSVKQGCLAAGGDYIVFTDADLSTPINEIEKLLEWLKQGYDIVIGSRALDESEILVRQPWYRETMGRIFNLLVQSLAVRGIRDTQCGFKGFKREAARDVFRRQKVTGFSFDVEVLHIALKLGYRIKEVPVRWLNRKESRVNPLTHSFQMLIDLIKIRLG